MEVITLKTNHQTTDFRRVELEFWEWDKRDVFGRKNNKTIAVTLQHRRYAHLSAEVFVHYSPYLNMGLGECLLLLKTRGDLFYRNFLNKYGDDAFCSFKMLGDLHLKGLYLYVAQNEIKYIGRCRDRYGKRINQGYGYIHPKNCYLDGQSTNCHLNGLINQNRESVALYIAHKDDDTEIAHLEKLLIQELQPEWNIALKRGSG